MNNASRRARAAHVARWASIPAALIISGLVIAPASYAAFNSTTSNPASNWAAGTVSLSDDDVNTALFTVSGLKPGSTGTKCIVVTSSGNLPSAVRVYGTGASTTRALSDSIILSIVQGNGGSFSSCSGFIPLASGSSLFSGTLSSFASTSTGFANGLGTWTPSGSAPESRTFQITYTLDPAAPSSTEGGTSTIAFTWESQNT